MTGRLASFFTLFLLASFARAADRPTDPREALKPFQDLIGSWRGTGEPEGTRQEKQRGFWIETMSWEWGFKGQDAWLQVMFEKSKHFTKGELRYLPEKDAYQFTVSTPAKESLIFTGTQKDSRLTLEREDP